MAGFISEISYGGGGTDDFIEIALPEGTDPSAYQIVIYDNDGEVDSIVALGTVQSTTAGQDVYLVDDSTPGFPGFSNGDAIALIDDQGNTLQFVSFRGEIITATNGPAAGSTSTDIGEPDGGETLASSDGGASYISSPESPGTIPCYASGTLIDTPDGPRPVETLRPGDLVLTVDHGPQPIRWVRCGDHPLEDAKTSDKPILIKAGALAANRPAQDLIVSPQHRILVGKGGQLTQYFDSVAFAPAKALTGLPGIRHMQGKAKITYIHFAFDQHAVVTANGCLSESLLLGSEVLKGLTPAERRAVTSKFEARSTADQALNGPVAHICLTVRKVHQKLTASAPSGNFDVVNDTLIWDRDAAMERYEAERLSV